MDWRELYGRAAGRYAAGETRDLDERQLYDMALNVIEPQLERIPGVASATVGGGKIREIEVEVQREAMRARGLAVLDVVKAVSANPA